LRHAQREGSLTCRSQPDPCGVVQEMEDLWPSGVPLRWVASNHLVLRWLTTVVVSVEEKGGVRAVRWGFRKTNESEPPMMCRDLGTDIRTGVSMRSRDEPGGETAYWPGGVRHVGGVSLICGFCAERGKARVDTAAVRDCGTGARGSASSSGNCEASSTDAARAGGPARSSDEAPVIGVERRGWLIRDLVTRATRISWEESSE
jgi:hypothetical protein